MITSPTVQDYRLLVRFDELREELLAAPDDPRLERPLAYWALGNDRRLPLVLMGRPTGQIVQSTFDDLRSTPGIGRKKLGTLMALLERAANDEGAEELSPSANGTNGHAANGVYAFNGSQATADDAAPATSAPGEAQPGEFDPDTVSEATWERWQQIVRRHHLEEMPLGRFAPSLQDLARVIWAKPLGEYVGLSLRDIRDMRTHGVKRIKAVTGVFYELFQAVGGSESSSLAVIIRPRFVLPLEAWLDDVLERQDFPGRDELAERLLQPLFDQMRIDVGDEIVDLAAGKLGLAGRQRPVRQAAADRGLTRARIYQMIAEVAEAMQVRWPEGEALCDDLRAKYDASTGPRPKRRWFFDALELFYSLRRK